MKLPSIEELIESDGQITIGHLHPVGCVALANDDHNTLAMLKRRPNESFGNLLKRLDKAIERAVEHDEYTDEVNT